MNLVTVCHALASQPGLGSHRIIWFRGPDSLLDPIGAVLVYSGQHPLDLQYYTNISTDKLWSCFSNVFIALDMTIDDVEDLFHLVDTRLPKTLTPKQRRDKVINYLLRKEMFNGNRSTTNSYSASTCSGTR